MNSFMIFSNKIDAVQICWSRFFWGMIIFIPITIWIYQLPPRLGKQSRLKFLLNICLGYKVHTQRIYWKYQIRQKHLILGFPLSKMTHCYRIFLVWKRETLLISIFLLDDTSFMFIVPKTHTTVYHMLKIRKGWNTTLWKNCIVVFKWNIWHISQQIFRQCFNNVSRLIWR